MHTKSNVINTIAATVTLIVVLLPPNCIAAVMGVVIAKKMCFYI
jgi:hypothetical protein